MNSEIKQCQNCKKSFTIEPEDFVFYEKMKVPAPTWCPECRLQRRLSFLNFIYLYKRQCALCKGDFIASYHPDSPAVVYCPKCWWSDNWDPREFGQDYDFSRPFFEQFRELYQRTPVIGIAIDLNAAINCPYNNYAGSLKNCYLLSQTDEMEDSAYGVYVFKSRDLYDTSVAMQDESCYDSMHIYKVQNGIGLRCQVYESFDCSFVRDSSFSSHCFASANLRGKQYHIFNKPYTKEAYFSELKKWDLGSYKTYKEIQKKAEDHWKTLPKKTQYDELSVDSTGVIVHQSKNCKNCIEVTRGEDSRYIMMTRDVKDSYDITMWGEIERCYEGSVGRNAANVRFGVICAEGAYDTEYSVLTHRGGTNNFGCVSMRYNNCILNKQYTKEEFLALVPQIRKHMEEMPYTDMRGNIYKYGEYFPPEFSPYGYNESLAYNMFPLAQDEAVRNGLPWFERPQTYHAIDRAADDLPDHINDVADEILKEVIGCKKCGQGFRVIPQELSFLKKKNLPLPRECPLCRIKEKLDIWMAELRTVKTHCTQCKKEIEISSSNADEKIILCKECYQKITD